MMPNAIRLAMFREESGALSWLWGKLLIWERCWYSRSGSVTSNVQARAILLIWSFRVEKLKALRDLVCFQIFVTLSMH